VLTQHRAEQQPIADDDLQCRAWPVFGASYDRMRAAGAVAKGVDDDGNC
jgi:hypothetical protein